MSQADLLVAHIRRTLGDWVRRYQRDETYRYAALGLSVVDAVYSIGVKYESTRHFARWAKWEKNRAHTEEHTISEFLDLIEPTGFYLPMCFSWRL
jgi:hypothetical protein